MARGGRREGAGRPLKSPDKEKVKTRSLNLTDGYFKRFKLLGGVDWLIKKIDEEQTYFVNTNSITSSMFIVNPFNNQNETHPPIEKRIEILLKLNSCNIAAYNNSYQNVLGKKSNIVSKKIIEKPNYSKIIPIVATAVTNQTINDEILNHREAYDTMLKLENYIFIKCDCNTKLKIPKELKGQKIPCPHCRKLHLIN